MIHLKDKKDCCGCSACEGICAKHCITMKADAEGFLYPQVDTTDCTNCGLCEKVCPVLNVPADNSVQRVIGAKHKDESVRSSSSSGGVFTLLAERFLADGGVVVGCIMNEQMEAVHTIAENKEQLLAMRSSKYVQSNTVGIYKQVRQLLRDGRKVLFSGTPCQVAALRNFLLKPYDNLFCIDILCHGVPSPKLLKDHKDALEKRYKGKMTSISFRDKEKGWKRLFIRARFDNGKQHFLFSGYDSYLSCFLNNRSQRPSCFECPYNTTNRPGDITLGDFWGIGKVMYEVDDNKGITLAIVNNEKGKAIVEQILSQTSHFDSDIQTAIAGNKVLVQHLPTTAKRDAFYADYTSHGYQYAISKHAPETPWHTQMYYNFMRWGLDLVRKIQHKSY